MLPDFLCIGAQKCGTTTIWHILDAHKDICMARPRETRFFCDINMYNEGVVKYETSFSGNGKPAKRAGEKCPEYLFVPGTAGRISHTLGRETRFIIALRSPAQRAFSQYRHNMTALRECRSFTAAMKEEAALLKQGVYIESPFGYVSRGFYAAQVKEYLKYFSKDKMLFVLFENEVMQDQASLAKKIYEFLGVDPVLPRGLPFRSGHPKLEMLSVAYQPAGNQVVIWRKQERGGLKNLLYRKQDIVDTIHDPSVALIEFAKAFNANKPRHISLTKEEETELNNKYFKTDIEQLQDITGWDLDFWLQ
jgi:hypothetical protein